MRNLLALDFGLDSGHGFQKTARALVESLLIVASILLALALDEWQEEQEIQELIDRSVTNFSNELMRNKTWINAERGFLGL